MNFDFSDDLNQLRDQARRYLAEHATTKHVRRVLDGEKPYDGALWLGMAEMGWLGAAIPEEYGGAGIGHEGLCVLAEELGRVVAPVPFASSVCQAAEALLIAGTPAQKRSYLPGFAAGMHIGTLAWAEGAGNPRAGALSARYAGGKVSGTNWPVLDGGSADLAVVTAQDEAGRPLLALADLRAGGVTRTILETVDPSRPQAKLVLDRVSAEPLGAPGEGVALLHEVLDRAAVLMAFEQLGGASVCLEMATAYAMERYAFGRPIGAFQSVSHMLADAIMWCDGAQLLGFEALWAIDNRGNAGLEVSQAKSFANDRLVPAVRIGQQIHGGIGFMMEFDIALYYRRVAAASMRLGTSFEHRERIAAALIDQPGTVRLGEPIATL